MLPWLYILLLPLSIDAALDAVPSIETEHDNRNHIQEMINWLNSMEGGYLSPKVEIRRWNVSDSNSYFGVFAVEDLDEGELIMEMPKERILQAEEIYQYYEDNLCELAWTLKEEFELGDESEFSPYINYLKTQRRGQLPAMWSDTGKALLQKVVDETFETSKVVSWMDGSKVVSWMDEWFEESCFHYEDLTLDKHLLALVMQRSFDTHLIPIYDMINHHAGKVNIYSEPNTATIAGPKEDFKAYAASSIPAGGELSYHYYQNNGSPETLGTIDILRDYGFVESYPREFHFQLPELTSFMVEKERMNTSNEVTLRWHNESFSHLPKGGIVHVVKEIERLDDVYQELMDYDESVIPNNEMTIILQIHMALREALLLLVKSWESNIQSKMQLDTQSNTCTT